jgi:hypothetical protein
LIGAQTLAPFRREAVRGVQEIQRDVIGDKERFPGLIFVLRGNGYELPIGPETIVTNKITFD